MVQLGKLYHPRRTASLTGGRLSLPPRARAGPRPHRLAGVDTRVGRSKSAPVSVVVPARNEQGRIGQVLAAVRSALPASAELIVVDDGSTDGTAGEASQIRGVTLVPAANRFGKGNALYTGVSAATGNVVVTCDADLGSLDARQLVGMAAILVERPGTSLVKARYRSRDSLSGYGGGRVTELVAKPLLEWFYPELATLGSPLAGEMAFRRDDALRLGFDPGYGVDVGLAIDMAAAHGRDSIAEVDMGAKQHPHQSLARLSLQAREVAAAILRRALPGVSGDGYTRLLENLAFPEEELL